MPPMVGDRVVVHLDFLKHRPWVCEVVAFDENSMQLVVDPGAPWPLQKIPAGKISSTLPKGEYFRPVWDVYFLAIAHAVAARSDCRRAKVGAVIVDTNRRIVSTGYVGTEPGGPSCLAGDCPRAFEDRPSGAGDPTYADCIGLHAEQNAITYAAWSQCLGGTIYVTKEPCPMCAKLIKAAGIVKTVTSVDPVVLVDLAKEVRGQHPVNGLP